MTRIPLQNHLVKLFQSVCLIQTKRNMNQSLTFELYYTSACEIYPPPALRAFTFAITLSPGE